MATDQHYFARPERTLFCDIRNYFPMSAQEHVHQVVCLYVGYAQRSSTNTRTRATPPSAAQAPQCRATTRKGTPCQRVPLPRNGYCPSHQHLAETEDREPAA